MDDMSHLDTQGNVWMVDVGEKDVTDRVAVAVAVVEMADATRERLFSEDLPKGDALAAVRIAAIQAAKRTPDLIPLCHPLSLTSVVVDIAQIAGGARIAVTVGVTARTGVEMEAMTAASVGALVMYDMIKGIDRGARIAGVELISKAGGRSGEWHRG
ncbi:MAG: cyclic pyranopterin monophosphate synthase MoaC [Acidimicrobiia bacterium]|nr:MAG: cyclic pyranopterin monophosphate synthase MoaC [Acidimicrobiia bacterium]